MSGIKLQFFFNKWLFLSLSSSDYCNTFVMSNESNGLTKKQMREAIAKMSVWFTLLKWQVSSLVLVALSLQAASAQGWEATFGGSREDQGIAILQTIDHGYLQVGFSESFGADGDIDIYAVRTDVDGTLLWERSYDPGFIEQPTSLIELSNRRGFIIAGFASANAGDPNQVYVLSINNIGEVNWSRTLNNFGLDQRANGISQTADGGYILVGQTQNPGGGELDILVVKLDANGNEEWREVYDNNRDDQGIDIVSLPNGYVFAANVKNQQGYSNIAIYRVDLSGNLLSVQVYGAGNNSSEKITDLLLTSDNRLVWVGSVDNDNKALLARSDLNGNLLWDQQLDFADFDDVLQSAVELEDGSIVAVGLTAPTASSIVALLVKMDTTGNLIWNRSLGSQGNINFGVSLAPTVDGGFVIGGYNSLGALVFFNDMLFFKVDGEGNYYSNRLQGRVFWPQNGCRAYQQGDPLMSGWLVKAESVDLTFIGSTDENGRYELLVDTGQYTVTLLPPNAHWEVCNPVAYIAQFTNFYDTTSYDFPVRAAYNCPFMEVNVSVPAVVECSNARYTVAYCNLGPAVAENAQLKIFLDDKLTFVNASIPYSAINEREFSFSVGDVGSYVCGQFTIDVALTCDDVVVGEAVLVRAEIIPDASCQPVSPEWDGSRIQVDGRCENGQVRFSIRNEGATMAAAQRYIVTEDVVVFLNDGYQLGGGQELPIDMPATGATYRLIVEQTAGSPTGLLRTIAVEGCTEDANDQYTTGVVAQFPENDLETTVDIDVQEVTNAVDAVGLVAHPKGYQDLIITPTTDIEYTIFFSNLSSTDTVSRVVIRDTLPQWLNPASLEMGPASHPFTYSLYGQGMLKITFDSINLLPVGSGEVFASQGFIKLRLAQKAGNPVGTVIENQVAVYFDYFEPRQTNAETHVVGCADYFSQGCLLVSVDEEPANRYGLKVYPNPLGESATFECERCAEGEVELRIFDALGRVVRVSTYNRSNSFVFNRQGLTPGIYMYDLRGENRELLGSGKLIAQ